MLKRGLSEKLPYGEKAMRFTHVLTAVVGLIVGVCGTQAAMAGGGLDTIKQRGVIKVGTKADYAPFGYRNAGGEVVGLEPDLAADVAQRLGVKLELVPVASANRMKFLQDGAIDLMIATMTFRPDRDEAVGIPRPFYYASALAALTPKASGLRTWEELQDKAVCVVQGAAYNRDIKARLIPQKDAEELLNALKQGKCAAAAYDSAFFVGKLQEPDWSDYEMTLPQVNPEPWGLAVKKEDKEFIDYMAGVITDWHKSGKIVELENKWKIPASPFAAEMNNKYK